MAKIGGGKLRKNSDFCIFSQKMTIFSILGPFFDHFLDPQKRGPKMVKKWPQNLESFFVVFVMIFFSDFFKVQKKIIQKFFFKKFFFKNEIFFFKKFFFKKFFLKKFFFKKFFFKKFFFKKFFFKKKNLQHL